jgi:tetratricopeptide (TPR) repeat protein
MPPDADLPLYAVRALEVLVEKVRSFEGRVAEMSPTGFVAAFGLEPVEDAPRRAAHAAMAIGKAAERTAVGASGPPTVKLAVHVDHVLVGQGMGAPQIDLDGKRRAWTVLEALAERAEAGAILVSEGAASLLERHFDLVPVDAAAGGADPVFRLARAARIELRSKGRMAKLVGRRHEMEFLRSRLTLALRGQGQVVGVVGDAGIGKSRLLFEFRRALSAEGVAYLAGRCYAHTSAMPFGPALSMLRKLGGIAETDGPPAIAERLGHALRALDVRAEGSLPYLLQLFGVTPPGDDPLAVLSPEAIRSRTLAALSEIALHASRRRPALVVVEDLQWIDRSSEECLALLVERLAGTRLLVLATYRPGYRPPWLDKSYATQIALQPLSPPESLSVVQSVLRDPCTPEPLVQQILDKAEGNPFFLEELSRVVDEQGALGETVTVPDTIEEVLLARIHRLAAEPRGLLQAASVLGRDVSLRLLEAIWDGAGPVAPHLQELTRHEFLTEESGLAEPACVFTHALTQEVAYGSLVPSRRLALHAAAGQALERFHADRLEDVHDRLAYHYARSDRADKAVEYLTRLADTAARGYALPEAVRALEDALAHVERLPAEERDRRRLALVLRQASSLIYLGRFQEALGLLLGGQAGVARLRDPVPAALCYFLLARTYLFLGEQEQALQAARRSIAEAERCGDQATIGKAHYVLCQQAALAGRALEGIEHGRQALACLESTGEQWWIGQSHWAQGLSHALLGAFGPALEAQARARRIGEAIASRQVQTVAAWATGIIHAAMGEWDAGVETCRRALELAPDPLNRAITAGWSGYAHVERGDGARAIPMLEEATRQLSRFQFHQFRALFTAFLAEAHQLAGESDRALDLAVQALGTSAGATSPYALGLARRALGRIHAARGSLADATLHLDQAVRTFASLESRYDLARAHLDLGLVARSGGHGDVAAGHLRKALELFTAMGVSRYVERTRALLAEVTGP